MRTISESGQQSLELVNDILDLSKIEAGRVVAELVDFDPGVLVDGIGHLWDEQFADKGLTFSVTIASDVPPVLRTDPTRLRQILLNLVSNAAKFTDTGGVGLDISQRQLASGAHELRFAVTDTGIGIAPEACSRLFAKCSQADGSITRRYGGTGLGLAISKALTELLGGEIGFESTLGAGSTFWFTVRCAIGDAVSVVDTAQTGAAPRVDTPVSDRPLRILVAEDNKVNQMVMRALLSGTGHRIDMVCDGVEAVNAVQKHRYDLVLMDIQMPEMDGLTATRRIRELTGDVAELPVIAVTAGAMKGDREQCIEAGMTDYLTKPIDRDALLQAIARSAANAEANWTAQRAG